MLQFFVKCFQGTEIWSGNMLLFFYGFLIILWFFYTFVIFTKQLL